MNPLYHEIRNLRRILPPTEFAHYLFLILLNSPRILRTRKLYAADAKMRGKFPVSYNGSEITIDCGAIDLMTPNESHCFTGVREMYGRDVYLRGFVPQHTNWEYVIDAGANRGLFSIAAAQVLRATRIISIEMQEKYENAINYLCSLNGIEGKVVVEIAELSSVGCPPVIPSGSPWISVPGVMQKHGLPRISLLKMDIEGGEFDVFSGDCAWLESCENIAMELHGPPTIITRQLRRWNFAVVTTDAAGNRVSEEATYLYASRTGMLKDRPPHAADPEESA